MKRVTRYRWITDSETPPGRREKTRHHMTAEQAHARHTNAVPIESTLEWLDVPETEAEHDQRMQQRKPHQTK